MFKSFFKFSAFAITVLLFAACDSFSRKSKDGYYGEKFDTTKAIAANHVSENQRDVLVKGTVTNSCKTEGCWVKLDAGNGEELFVSTEEKFYLPIEGLQGKTVYVKGVTFMDTTSVDELRHQAADAGKTDSEINAITEPEIEVSVVATGIKIL